MPFAYYDRLTKAQQQVYRQSEGIASVPLPGAVALRALVRALAEALASESRQRIEAAAQDLVDGLTLALRVPPVRLRVLAARPARDWGELHGLYSDDGAGRRPSITLWMRTAQRRQVVAFRTFLRTLLHELCHHLDYALLALPDSFHTQGFYKRESHLFHQLVPFQASRPPEDAPVMPDPSGAPHKVRRAPEQPGTALAGTGDQPPGRPRTEEGPPTAEPVESAEK